MSGLHGGRCRHLAARRSPGAVGRTRTGFAFSFIARRRVRHDALRCLPLSPLGALWRACKPSRRTVVSVWVMPMGIAGALLVPLGLDGIFWQLMGYGLDWMIAVALWVTSLPGAVGRITAFGVGPLLLGTAGLVVLCLLKSPLRYGGAAFLAAGIFWAAATPQPDVLLAPKWRGRGGSRCKRPAGDVQIRQRQFCFPALALRRCRWALGQG